MSKIKAMEQIWRDVCVCQKCNIAKYVRNRVFGDGNVKSKIVLVGEAPGMDEDKRGRVFVGNAGQILRKCLLAAGLKPERLFIANILKCHPPETLDPPSGNRTPSVKEMINCVPFLKRQLDIIDPKIIVALGNTAGSGLLRPEIKKVTVTSMFGQEFERDGRKIVLTYHPQYLGYRSHDPSIERDYIDLFKRIKSWKN
jgi:DNA polymerase